VCYDSWVVNGTKTMPQFTLTCTDEDATVTSKEFEATILTEVVEKTQDFLHGVGYVFEELQVLEENTIDEDENVIPFNR
tara:strand:+ start:869 stop:1105 length:237 start_codon:yes stop_codon:yes gene_type:complete